MHCIQVYVTKNDGSFESVPHLKLPQDFVLFTEKPKGLKKDRLVAYLETDYFGGCGQQSAKVWDNKKKVFGMYSGWGSINNALKIIGVKAEDENDEFDTIGLGKYRENEAIDNAILNQ